MPARRKATRWTRWRRSPTRRPRRKPPRRRWKTRSNSVSQEGKKGRHRRPFSFQERRSPSRLRAALVMPLDGLEHFHRREIVGQQLRSRLWLDLALRAQQLDQVVAQLALLGERGGALAQPRRRDRLAVVGDDHHVAARL